MAVNRPFVTTSERQNVDDLKAKKERPPFYYILEQDIRTMSAEIYRLIKMPYASWGNKDRIRKLEDQIIYLESMMAKYEDEQRKMD